MPSVAPAPVSIDVLRDPEASPAAFATWSYRLENRSARALTLELDLLLPPDWSAVTPSRRLMIPPSDVQSVPFTVWIPPLARADTAHVVNLRIRDEDGAFSALAYRHAVHVRPVAGVSVSCLEPKLLAHPGRQTVARFVVTNTGNCTAVYHLRTTSVPDWPLGHVPGHLRLAPGAQEVIEVRSTVPEAARSQTIQILRLRAEGDKDEGAALVADQDQARITVVPDPAPIALHSRLPVEAAVSMGELQPGRGYLGLRLASQGDINPETRFDLDLDLATGSRSIGVTGWQEQRLRLAFHGPGWTLALGDVTSWFPDLAVRSLSGRGIGLNATHGLWNVRFFGGRNRTPGSTASWGAGADRQVRSTLRLGGDILLLEEDAGRLGTEKSRLVVGTAAVDSLHGWDAKLEAALSQRSLEGDRDLGGAAQLLLDRDGSNWTLRGRAYAGSSEFSGRSRGRDGLSAYARMVPWNPVRLWLNGDLSSGRVGISPEAPDQETRRIRVGTRLAPPDWPALEVTLGRTRDKGDAPDSLRNTERRDFTATMTGQAAGIFTSATGRWGTVRNLGTNGQGRIQDLELSVGGRIRGVRAAAHWAHQQEWAPLQGEDTRTSTLTGDLSWGSRTGDVQAGLSFSSRSVDSGQTASGRRRDLQARPRTDIRLAPKWNVGLEASFFGPDRSPSLDRWQLQIGYSSQSLLPAIWSPTRGRLEVLVFADDDMDGEPDASELRVAGVLLKLDANPELTDPGGMARWPAISPGTWWIELESGSLPQGLSPAGALPMEVRVEAGVSTILHIPLSRSGIVSGLVYLDETGDGKLSAGERPLPEMRMALVQEGRVIKECLTGDQGRYQLPGVPPGEYELRVADGWLPRGWEATGAGTLRIRVLPGQDVRAAPYGIAPKRKPIIRTFQGATADPAETIR